MPPEEVPGGILLRRFEGRPLRLLAISARHSRRIACASSRGRQNEVGLPKIDTTAVIFEEGVGLEVPLRVHLNNPLLGRRCYVGSPGTPIVMRFTTGTTSPPRSERADQRLSRLARNQGRRQLSQPRNEYRRQHVRCARGRRMRGFASPIVDRMIDRAVGLPSPAGTNSAKLQGTLSLAVAEAP